MNPFDSDEDDDDEHDSVCLDNYKNTTKSNGCAGATLALNGGRGGGIIEIKRNDEIVNASETDQD